eukprot:1161028-Pelagomonas_calceolata.AAC.6
MTQAVRTLPTFINKWIWRNISLESDESHHNVILEKEHCWGSRYAGMAKTLDFSWWWNAGVCLGADSNMFPLMHAGLT